MKRRSRVLLADDHAMVREIAAWGPTKGAQ